MDQNNHSQTNITQKTQDIISFFGDDSSFVFAYKKTEKLVAAVYLVSNLFPENEPMKLSLRKKSGELLSFILSYKDVKGTALSDFVYLVRTQVLEITSLLEIATIGGLVSQMNFSVLKGEFSHLLETLDGAVSAHKESSQHSISGAFFDIEKIEQTLKQSHSHGGYYQPVAFSKASFGDIKDIHDQSKDGFKRTNRQNIILGIIKKKKEVTIKDIAQVIKDCSEKTIQRELISFMELGVIKRTGERRWSKYSLV